MEQNKGDEAAVFVTARWKRDITFIRQRRKTFGTGSTAARGRRNWIFSRVKFHSGHVNQIFRFMGILGHFSNPSPRSISEAQNYVDSSTGRALFGYVLRIKRLLSAIILVASCRDYMYSNTAFRSFPQIKKVRDGGERYARSRSRSAPVAGARTVTPASLAEFFLDESTGWSELVPRRRYRCARVRPPPAPPARAATPMCASVTAPHVR
ncbi:hypothetical protein EVAR_46308_1 [Eumeta japonica]|uniref:Uncharacterized protein n=1 Tax=Eumeta variegata TaxID=151549 RepID=A0A4C1Y167_EUMVA|nr:hypothetical protein EVAR_46308_1 [Eumeta japonica]